MTTKLSDQQQSGLEEIQEKPRNKTNDTAIYRMHPQKFLNFQNFNKDVSEQSSVPFNRKFIEEESSTLDSKIGVNFEANSKNTTNIIAGFEDSNLQQFGESLEFALENRIFPELHIEAISNEGQFSQSEYKYKRTTNEVAVKFVLDYLNDCWENQKTEQSQIGYYAILFNYNKKLKIMDWSEEKRLGSRLDLYFIIRYFQKSGSFDETFFNRIWNSAPTEVKTALKLD